jgi:serine/threonine protein kinase
MPETPPLLDGFDWIEHLGSGGQADVHRYRQRKLARDVAVKVLRQSTGLAAEMRRRFAHEANMMACLGQHPHIVQIFDVATAPDGRPYLTMEHYPESLEKRLTTSRQLATGDVLRIGIQVAGAVETAHRAGVLHRDIKPANILISAVGEPGLSDFGAAGRGDADEGDLGVSLPWAPPEVVDGRSDGSPQSDVYSLGASLWHLLVGRSPFSPSSGGIDQRELMRRIRETPAPQTARADVPPGLERLLRQALSKDPAQRPSSAVDFARGLRQIERELGLGPTKDHVLAHTPTPASPAVAQPPTAVPTTRRAVAVPTTRRPSLSAAPSTSAYSAASLPAAFERPVAATMQRPAKAATTEPPPADAAPALTGRRGRVALLAGASAITIAAVTVAITLAGRHAPARPNTPAADLPADPADDQVAVDDGQPDLPIVTVHRTGGHLHFSWTVRSTLGPGDTFLWRNPLNPRQQGNARTATVDLPAKGQVCLQVAIRRPGTGGPPQWSVEKCAT